ASDGKSLCTDGTWKASCSDNKLLAAGETLSLGFANLNRAAANDTYTFTAQWKEIVIEVASPGDADGDGAISMMDLSAIKYFIAIGGSDGGIIGANCDVNCDGVVNFKDISDLKVLIAG
ncbi:MAG: hypothetical protein IKN38_05230, partial [Clostridia bacterium]|nr:hypothetical protein [Clostridia bacterium]